MRTLFPLLLFIVSAVAVSWSVVVAKECDRRAAAAEEKLGQISEFLKGREFLTPESTELKKLEGLVERLFSHIAELKIRVSGIAEDLKSKEQPTK